jgi:hypothetical protein
MLEINEWTKFSNGSGGNNCVEVKYDPFNICVRNSNHKNDGTLLFTPEEWKSFVEGVKKGVFDI